MHKTIKKIVVLAWDDRWSSSIWRSFQKIVENVEVIHVHQKSSKEVAHLVEKAKPDLCFAKNFRVSRFEHENTEEELETIFSSWKFPLAVWYLDNPKFQDCAELQKKWAAKQKPSNMLFFYNDPSFQYFFDDHELPAHHLPIGVDDIIFDVRSPQLEAGLKASLRFSGHTIAKCDLPEINSAMITLGHVSMILNEFEEYLVKNGSDHKLAVHNANLIEAPLNQYFSEFYILPEAFFQNTSKFFSASEQLLPRESFCHLKKMESRIIEIYSWWQLTSYLYLLTDKGIIVQGSEDWKPFFPRQREVFRELSWEELFASYRSTRISFCFTKWSLPFAVHDRIYEVLAAGGFPLTDFRKELAHQFESDEIVVYHSIQEARELIDFYTEHDSSRIAIAEKGRARVANEHLYQHRLNKLLDKAAKHFQITG